MPGLIPCPRAIWLAVAPVDMRLGADGLSLHVQQALRSNPGDGSAYLFRNKRGNRIKLLVWDGNGVVPAPPASGRFRLAQARRAALFPDPGTVAMAGGGGGLAASVCPSAHPFQALKRAQKNARIQHSCGFQGGSRGIMTP